MDDERDAPNAPDDEFFDVGDEEYDAEVVDDFEEIDEDDESVDGDESTRPDAAPLKPEEILG